MFTLFHKKKTYMSRFTATKNTGSPKHKRGYVHTDDIANPRQSPGNANDGRNPDL